MLQRPLHRFAQAGALAALCALAAAASAQSGKVTIYRCTDAKGALTVQNDVPCPPGSRQDKRVLDASPPPTAVFPSAPASMPAAPTRPAPTAPRQSTPRAPDELAALPPVTIADADRLPPPALFECRTYDNDRYLREDPNPPRRCAPLQTTGLGGLSEGGAGGACEMVDDQCQRIGDDAACERWRTRLREVQAQLRFGTRDNREAHQAEFERVARIVRESTCGR